MGEIKRLKKGRGSIKGDAMFDCICNLVRQIDTVKTVGKVLWGYTDIEHGGFMEDHDVEVFGRILQDVGEKMQDEIGNLENFAQDVGIDFSP